MYSQKPKVKSQQALCITLTIYTQHNNQIITIITSNTAIINQNIKTSKHQTSTVSFRDFNHLKATRFSESLRVINQEPVFSRKIPYPPMSVKRAGAYMISKFQIQEASPALQRNVQSSVQV